MRDRDQIRFEHLESKDSLDSPLQFERTCSIRIRSRNRDIVRKRFRFWKISQFLVKNRMEHIETEDCFRSPLQLESN